MLDKDILSSFSPMTCEVDISEIDIRVVIFSFFVCRMVLMQNFHVMHLKIFHIYI